MEFFLQAKVTCQILIEPQLESMPKTQIYLKTHIKAYNLLNLATSWIKKQ